jgi:O-antigen/teichoic acid export membrane protein
MVELKLENAGEIMSNNIVRGTMLLTGASFLSKFLGMIYIIPFNEVVGTQGGALYFYAYNPYSILISVSTVGVPLAVSKFVSKYNALGDYETGMQMFRTGIMMMAVTGFLAFLALFFGAGFLAEQIISNDKQGNTVEDVKMVMRMVSFALLIIPSMSIVRGFFQGYQSMGPTAFSQIAEQIIRIGFVLVSVFLVVDVFGGSIPTAVGFATFAAFIGALASCVVLAVYWKKRKLFIRRQIEQQQQSTHNLSKKDLILELFRYAGPFVLVGIAIPLYQGVDQFTFNRAMDAIGQGGIAEFSLASILMYGHKLVIIPVTIATGLSLAIIPQLTESFMTNDRKLLFKQINQALQIVLTLVIPAVVGLMILSTEAYGSLFGMEKIGITGSLLAWYAPVALFYALFTVSAAILQGINEQRFAIVSLGAGLLIKVLFNIPLIHAFGAKGSIIATGLAVLVAVVLNLWKVKKSIDFSYRQTIKRTLLISIFTVIMCSIIWILKMIIGIFFSYKETRLGLTIMLGTGVIFGGGVYMALAYYSTLLERVLGGRITFLDKILRR